MDDQPAGRCAALASGAEGAPERAFDGQLEIGIFHDDLRVLAAEFEGYALEILAAHRSDLATDCGGTGERNQLHILVTHQRRADIFAAAMYQIDDARRHAGLVENLDEASCRVWRILGRFENHRIAANQRRK